MPTPSRRAFLRGSALAGAALGLSATSSASRPAKALLPAVPRAPRERHPIRLSCKYGMVGIEGSMADKFKLLAKLGFDGVELDSPAPYTADEVRAAQDASGLPVHGVVDSVHWQKRLSSPDEATREEGLAALEGAIRDSKAFGGSSVLLVPGRVADAEHENHEQVWERSIAGIRRALPLAAELGIHILIENVWNGFCYDHGGDANQSAERFAEYIDEIGSPWIGMYHDLGNHRKYGHVEEWVRTLARRIVKVDVKGWGFEAGWCKIGDGDVNWPEVRKALREVHFTGWATAEVGGGDEAWLAEVKERMERVLRAD